MKASHSGRVQRQGATIRAGQVEVPSLRGDGHGYAMGQLSEGTQWGGGALEVC